MLQARNFSNQRLQAGCNNLNGLILVYIFLQGVYDDMLDHNVLLSYGKLLFTGLSAAGVSLLPGRSDARLHRFVNETTICINNKSYKKYRDW
jgi:hypothetical protein